MRGSSRLPSSVRSNRSTLPTRSRKGKSKGQGSAARAAGAPHPIRSACRSVVEGLEQRQLLAGDGFVASFYNVQINDVPTVDSTAPTYSTHLDTINLRGQSETNAPPDAPGGWPFANKNPGLQFTGRFDFQVVVPAGKAGYYTFFPTTDDGAAVKVDGVVLANANNSNLGTVRAATEDTDVVRAASDTTSAKTLWAAGSTHQVSFYFENGGGGWDYALQWSANSTDTGTANDVYAKDFVPGTGAASPVQAVQRTDPGNGGTSPDPGPQLAIGQVSSTDTAGTPTVLSAAPGGVTLQWSTHDVDAASYVIERSTGAGIYTPLNAASPVPSTNGGNAFYKDTTAAVGTTYFYRVISNSIVGKTNPGLAAEPRSAPVQALVLDVAPAIPVISNAAPGAANTNIITIKVDPAATSYDLLRSPTLNGTYTQVGTGVPAPGAATATLADTTATGNNGNYYYKVRYNNPNAGAANQHAPSAPVFIPHGDGFAAGFFNDNHWHASTGATAGDLANQDNVAVGTPDYRTIDQQINFTGGGDAVRVPETPTGFNGASANVGDNVSAEWDTNFVAQYSEQYTFYSGTDDGTELIVDGVNLDDKPFLSRPVPAAPGDVAPAKDSSGNDVTWSAGSTHAVRFLWQQGTGGYGYVLRESSASQAVQVVPQYQGYVPLQSLNTTTPSASTAPVGSAAPANVTSAVANNTVQLTWNSGSAESYNVYRSTTPITASTPLSSLTKVGTVNATPYTQPGTPTYTFSDNATSNPSSPPQNGTTYYYAIIGVTTTISFAGDTSATNSPKEGPAAITAGITPPNQPGVKANYFNNPWWRSTDQSTTAPQVSGVGSQVSTVALTSDETATLSVIDAHGTDTSSGVINTTGTTNDAALPDPAGAIGPDNFSVVFTGAVNILAGSTAGNAATNYTFYPTVDDDGYLYVDDQLVAADPGGHGPETPPYPVRNTVGQPGGTVQPVAIALTAGKHNIEFFQSNGGGGWDFHLFYKGPDTAGTAVIVPTGNPTNNVKGLTTQMSPLATPTGFTATGAAGDPTRATVTWNNNNTSAVRYVIQRSTTNTFTAATTTTFDAGPGLIFPNATTGAATSGTLTYNDSGLALNTTYFYRIAAQNFDGTSAFTTVGPTTTVATANAVPTPTVTTARQADNLVELAWTEAFTPAQGLNGFQVLRSTDGTNFTTVATLPATQTSYIDNGPSGGFTVGTTYTYKVIATGTGGTTGTGGPANSSPSAPSAVTYLTVSTLPAINHVNGFANAGGTDLQLNGSTTVTPNNPNNTGGQATNTSGNRLELTPAANFQTGTAFTRIATDVGDGFTTSFDFQFTSPGADGFEFVIQEAAPTFLGTNGGGSFGYDGTTAVKSFGVYFNMYNNVTQTGAGFNGTNGATLDMSTGSGGAFGNAFHATNASNQTDIFHVVLTYDKTAKTLTETVTDTANNHTFTYTYGAASNTVAPYAAPIDLTTGLGDKYAYVGFTGATGALNAQQDILDWNLASAVAVSPTVSAIGTTDNPTAAAPPTGTQRSQVRGLVVTFASPTASFSASQLALSLLNTGGSGVNDNSAPTALPNSVFGTPAPVAGSNNTQWVVPFVAFTANTSATGSLNDGIYALTLTGVSGSGITSLTFHRLFGDTDGNKTVNALDYARFKSAFGTSNGNPAYNPDLDFDNNGTINALDYGQFKSRFGKIFNYT